MANTSNKKKPVRKTAPAKKGTASKSGAQRTSAQNNAQSRTNSSGGNQIAAIILFASALLLLFLVFVSGSGIWGALRSLLFGLFGFTAYLYPFILIYIAVMATLDRLDSKASYKVIESVFLITIIASAIHIFGFSAEKADYLTDIANAFNNFRENNSVFGSGALGAAFGGLVLLITGSSKAPAVAIIIVLLFIALMLVTGTTLIKLFRGVAYPVKKVSKMTGDRFAEDEESEYAETEKEEKPSRKRRERNPLDEEFPELDIAKGLPVAAETAAEQDDTGIAKPVQLDDIIRHINGENVFDKKAEDKKPEKEKTAEIKGADAEPKKEESTDGEPKKVEFKLPGLDCLAAPKAAKSGDYEQELKQNATKLVDTLKSFGVDTRIVDISRGPSVTRYEIQPAAGVKISRITNLADDIALNLAASGVRIEAPIPNKAAVGIEVPNKTRAAVTFREMIDTDLYKKNVEHSKLSVALGKDIAGNCTYADISKMPHLLVCGTTGSGKSVCLNTMIVSILFNATPDEVKLIMIDPKQVEFTIYNGIPHLLIPVVSDPRKASGALSWAVGEMLRRYKQFSDNNVRDIGGYNSICESLGEEKMPQIVIFIDELSDLMMAAPHEVEDSICRLAQMARAAGMHLVIATQRPSVDVITGLIKANIPSRLSLKTSSQIDSRTIIDAAGAEKLLGNGDMLFYPVGIAKPVRIQGCYLSDKEVENVVEFLKKQQETQYDEEVIEEINRQAAMEKKKGGASVEDSDSDASDSDEMLPKAIEVVVDSQMASATLLQRKLKLGYARAARIIDELEERGIIGPYEGSKPRKVLITKQQWYEMNALAQGGAEASVPAEAIGQTTADEGVLSVDGYDG